MPAPSREFSGLRFSRLKPTNGQLQDSYDDDEEERQEFSVGENVLNQSPPLHVGTVDEDEHAWRNQRLNGQLESTDTSIQSVLDVMIL